jgi:predicted aminopeptidase
MGCRHIVTLLLALVSGGCTTFGYYVGAANGQLELMRKAHPVEGLIADPATDPALAERLKTARAIIDFADDALGLPAGGSYADYAAIDRPFVAWNVFAAEEFSLRPEQWCYPLVGCLAYRGHFDPASAELDADRQRALGHDVHVGGVLAYSTLGWFDDPLLDTFLFRRDDRLAALLFHELAHRRLFVPGDTLFNESFATAIAIEGVNRWLDLNGDAGLLNKREVESARRQAVIDLLLELRRELERLYASGADQATMRRDKAGLIAATQADYARLRADWDGDAGYDAWMADGLNNAKLNTVGLYHRLVPAFRALLVEHGGEFEAFYIAVEALAAMPEALRHARLEELAPLWGLGPGSLQDPTPVAGGQQFKGLAAPSPAVQRVPPG